MEHSTTTTVPGTYVFNGRRSVMGYPAEPHVHVVQLRREPRGVQARRGRVLRALRPAPEQRERDSRARRPAARAAGREHLLPRQVRRHLQSQRAGPRRPAARHDVSTSSRRDARRSQESSPMAGLSAASPRRTFPRSAPRSPKALEDTTGPEAVLRRLRRRSAAGSTRSSPMSPCVIYNDHGLSFFLDHIPTFAIGAAATYPNEDSGWGLECCRGASATSSCRGISSSRSWPTNSTSRCARR